MGRVTNSTSDSAGGWLDYGSLERVHIATNLAKREFFKVSVEV